MVQVGKMWKQLALVGLVLIGLTGCDGAEDLVDDALGREATAPKEAELPQCSQIVNCCASLQSDPVFKDITPEDVKTSCNDVFTPGANSVIDAYQTGRDGLNGQANKDRFRDESTTRIEPACTCLLQETVAKIPDTINHPDCELKVPEVAECSMAVDTLGDYAANPPMVEGN